MQKSLPLINYQCRRQLVTLTLREVIDISLAAELQKALLRAVTDPKATAICINLTEVERMDISTIQLLLAVRNECEKAERTFKVEGMMPAVETLFSQIGIRL